MSTAATTSGDSETAVGRLPTPGDGPARTLALACALGLTGSYVAVLHGVTVVVGGTRWLVAGVAVALLLATVLAHVLAVRSGMAVGGALLFGGLGGYLLLIPDIYYALFTLDRIAADLLAMVAGRSVVLFLRADLWAIGVAPGPAFLGWYLALRGRYDLSALVGSVALGFFVLTSDAGSTVTLAGMAAALGLLGFGAIERSAGTWNQVTDLGLAVGFAVVAARLVNVVPSGSSPFRVWGGPGGPAVEGELVDAGAQLSIQGAVSLSPTRRFTIAADRPGLWHAGAYDRYTGGGWARAGGTSGYDGSQASPPGGGRVLRQRVRIEATVATMPAAWKPVLLDPASRDSTQVTTLGGLHPTGPFEAGDEYDVLSQVPVWTEDQLQRAGTDYPSGVAERFRQLPSTLSGRFFETADTITESAETPYEKAIAIQRWLVENKTYSLEVSRPSHDIADAFVHDMERGYCTYFATSMAALLRAVDVPARFAVGYLPGEQVAEGEWAVRGNDSHAWVEVYFPGVGWVPFDPTPSAPRETARRQRSSAPEREPGAAAAGGGTDGQDGGVGTAEAGAGNGGEDGTATTTTAATTDGPDAGEVGGVGEGGGGSEGSGVGGDDESGGGDESGGDDESGGGGAGGGDGNGNEGNGSDLPEALPGSAPEPMSSLGKQGPVEVRANATAGEPSPSSRITAATNGSGNTSGGPDLGDTGEAAVEARDRLSAVVAVGGLLAGAYRLGLYERAAREVWLRWLPRTESAHDDVRRAYDRLEYYLGTRYRERESGETPQEYLDDLADQGADPRIRRVGAIHQRSRYGERVTRSAADEAIRLVEAVVRGK